MTVHDPRREPGGTSGLLASKRCPRRGASPSGELSQAGNLAFQAVGQALEIIKKEGNRVDLQSL